MHSSIRTLASVLLIAVFATLHLPASAAHHEAEAEHDGAATVADIDAYRAAIEGDLDGLERNDIDLSGARSQVRQKWHHMHAYLRDGEVVRIKLYPHEGISERSEEFYYRAGDLVLVHIEDEGASRRGSAGEAAMGKTYYFDGTTLIEERNASGEGETGDQSADAARLLQEAGEYLTLAQG